MKRTQSGFFKVKKDTILFSITPFKKTTKEKEKKNEKNIDQLVDWVEPVVVSVRP